LKEKSHWQLVFQQFRKKKLGFACFCSLLFLALVGLYAPLLASSKPLVVIWHDKLYFPLLRYLFFSGFYTKPIDLFYNLLMFTLPIGLLGGYLFNRLIPGPLCKWFLVLVAAVQIIAFIIFSTGLIKDPAGNMNLNQIRHKKLQEHTIARHDPLLRTSYVFTDWNFELAHMTPYKKLNLLLKQRQQIRHHKKIAPYAERFESIRGKYFPSLYNIYQHDQQNQIEQLQTQIEASSQKYQQAKQLYSDLIQNYQPFSNAVTIAKYRISNPQNAHSQSDYEALIQASSSTRSSLEAAQLTIFNHLRLKSKLAFLEEKKNWVAKEDQSLKMVIWPLIRPFHWEDNAGGSSLANQILPWYETTRINRKDLTAAIIFGIRISLVVGFTAVALSLFIGSILGMTAGYFAGKADLVICRWIEIWEAMPTFFMLLLIVAITQSKSIFLIIAVLGLFGWTGFARFMRAEVLKQRALPYTLAAKSLGFNHFRIMNSHILPNAIAPLLTLLPFSMMAAITSEAGLSFLGLGEEGSTSLGVLMDEGRTVFPSESYLLWPAAIVLTILLISIALVGDAFRDAIDPKMRS